MDAALYGDGSLNGGKQLTGLATAIPILSNTGVYGGIDLHRQRRGMAHGNLRCQRRAVHVDRNASQRDHDPPDAQPDHDQAVPRQGLRGPVDHVAEHYAAYDAATVAIQRITNEETSMGKLGFSSLEYVGGGKRAEDRDGRRHRSNMPANTTFGIDTDSLRLRYHPNRNFDTVRR